MINTLEVIKAIKNAEVKIGAFLDTLSAKREEIFEEFCSSYEPNKFGLVPTLDSQGRIHAPSGGYAYEDETGIVSYIGGEYMPNSSFENKVDEYTGSFVLDTTKTIRFKTLSSECDKIESEDFVHTEVSSGSTWIEGDDEVCYCYIKSKYKTVINAIEEIIKREQNNIIDERNKEKERIALLGDIRLEGKQTVVGEIIRFYFKEGFNGYSQKCMVVKLQSEAVVLGSFPIALEREGAEVGNFIEFTATFTPRINTTNESFFKRPSKSRMI